MIVMKSYFLFIVINVFVWNSIVYAENAQLEIVEYINELSNGEYKDKMLIISNLFLNLKHKKNYSCLMYLAEKYSEFGLKVLAFLPSDQNLEGIEYVEDVENVEVVVPKRFIYLNNNIKIEIIYDDKAQNFWDSMNNNENMKKKINDYIYYDQSIRVAYHTFLVGRNDSIIEGYLKIKNPNTIFTEITEYDLIFELRPWNSIESMYELVVKNLNGVRVEMKKYRNKVLIVSFITLLNVTENKEKYQYMLNLAHNIEHLMILFIMNDKTNADLISKDITYNKNVHLIEDNVDALILKEFLKLKIQAIDNSSQIDEIDEIIINKKGTVFIEFKADSSEEWNSIVYPGKDQLGFNEYVKEFKIEEYKDKVLIMSNLFPNKEQNENYSYLMYLAKKYFNFGLRVVAFQPCNQLYTLERIENVKNDEPKRLIDLMNDNKIEIICDNKAWISMNNNEDMKLKMRKYYINHLYGVVYHTFLVGRNDSIIEGYLKKKNTLWYYQYNGFIMEKIIEPHLILILELWNYTESIYKLWLKKFNGVSLEMKEYRNKVLIVSFITQNKITENEEKYQYMLKLADNNKNLIILFIMHDEINTDLISEDITYKKNVHLIDDNVDAFNLKEFFKLKIPAIDNEPVKIDDIIINRNGNVFVEFKVNSAVEMIKKMLAEPTIVEDMNIKQ